MKKLMITIAATVCAAALNAASFTWNVANVYTPTLNNLSPNKNNSTTIAATANVLATLMWSSDGSSWNEVNDASTDVAFTKAGGFTTAQTAFDHTAIPEGLEGKNYYKVLITYTDTDGNVFKTDLYEKTNVSPTQADMSNLANNAVALTFQGLIDANTGRTWTTSAVPEPTSGLLLLLGVAGLALRRRRA